MPRGVAPTPPRPPGAPFDAKVVRATSGDDGARTIEFKFEVLTPNGASVARQAVLCAKTPKGSASTVFLVAGATKKRWDKDGVATTARAVAASFYTEGAFPVKRR